MKIHVLINTYNRPEQLNELLNSIEIAKICETDITVFNDGSTKKYNVPENIGYYEFTFNHGKKRYWQLCNFGISTLKDTDYDYYFMLPDDDTVSKDFFREAIDTWEAITDERKICLSTNLLKGRIEKTCWTNTKAVLKKFGDKEVYLTQWQDLCFMSTRKFFEVLNYKIDPINEDRWNRNPNRSSGVAQQMTLKLFKKGYNMYHVTSSLVYTKYPYGSVMQTAKQRKSEPIIQVYK